MGVTPCSSRVNASVLVLAGRVTGVAIAEEGDEVIARHADRVIRIHTETAEAVEFPLPRQTNIRRIFVDDSSKPSTVWIGNNEGASIIKLQALD